MRQRNYTIVITTKKLILIIKNHYETDSQKTSTVELENRFLRKGGLFHLTA